MPSSDEYSLAGHARHLNDAYGQRKDMGSAAPESRRPHFFLLRTFQGQNDLLVILNTKRCRYQCDFCQLPAKSSKVWIPGEDVVAQFAYVLDEMKHALSILDRVTLSNEGSILDPATLDPAALESIADAVNELRRVRTLVIETRVEFVDLDVVRDLEARLKRAKINVLTGFETADQRIRDRVLRKREPLDAFLSGLDVVSLAQLDLTAYVLFKPDPEMSDEEAYAEARRSIEFLHGECEKRGIGLTIRLNPMYLAAGSVWAKRAMRLAEYQPPRLTDCLKLAEEVAAQGIPVYVGLSSEGLSDPSGTYVARDDYKPELIKAAKVFNDGPGRAADQAGVHTGEGTADVAAFPAESAA
jgi:radical SAM enzyme (TIGR01210 family)